jgi:hypothetical protein
MFVPPLLQHPALVELEHNPRDTAPARPGNRSSPTSSTRIMIRWMGDWADLQPKAGGVVAIDINGIPIRGEYSSSNRRTRSCPAGVPPVATR